MGYVPFHYDAWMWVQKYSKTGLKPPLKRRSKIGFQDQLSLNAGQKYCRMLQGEHSAMLSTFIKLPFAIKICVLSVFEWPLKTGFTVCIPKIIKNLISRAMADSKNLVMDFHHCFSQSVPAKTST